MPEARPRPPPEKHDDKCVEQGAVAVEQAEPEAPTEAADLEEFARNMADKDKVLRLGHKFLSLGDPKSLHQLCPRCCIISGRRL